MFLPTSPIWPVEANWRRTSGSRSKIESSRSCTCSSEMTVSPTIAAARTWLGSEPQPARSTPAEASTATVGRRERRVVLTGDTFSRTVGIRLAS